MAMKIGEDCISCGACESTCPNNAITEGETQYEIDASKCTECQGVADAPQCAENCPVDAISKA